MEKSSRPSHFSGSEISVKTPQPGDRMWGVAQVAETLSMSDRTVRYLAALGELPGSKIGRAWRFWRSEILKYLEDHRGENLLG